MTIRYLIISILFIAVSFFIGYSINPYGAHENMKNQMVTIIMPDGTGIEGTRKDTIFIEEYCDKGMFEAAAILDRISMIMSDESFTITYHGAYFKADKVIPRDSVMENFVKKKNKEIKKRQTKKPIDSTAFWADSKVAQFVGNVKGCDAINTYVYHNRMPIVTYIAYVDSTNDAPLGVLEQWSKVQYLIRYEEINDSIVALEYQRGMQVLNNLYKTEQNH